MSNRPHRADVVRTISRGFARDANRAAIFATILTKGPLSRSDIARETGLSAATVSKVVKPLVDERYVSELAEISGIPGRPSVPVEVNATRATAIGFKLTASELTGVAVDLKANVLAQATRRLRSTDPEQVVSAIATLCEQLTRKVKDQSGPPMGIGIGIGGHVSPDGRVVKYATFLGWKALPLADLVEAATGLDTVVENDVDSLALTEQWFGMGKGVANFALVTVGAGVGSAFVVNDGLLHGTSGLAGELGHLTISRNGEQCACGNNGCLETVASESAIVRYIAGHADGGAPSFEQAVSLARDGDATARRAFTRAGDALGLGVCAILNLLNPELILISGEGLVAGELLLEPMKRTIAQHSFSTAASDCRIEVAPHDADTWARGAAALVLHTLISRSAQLGGSATE